MVQGSLTNIAKYAAADAAEILVRNYGDTITVAVRDNSQGFNAAQARARGHGLRPAGTDL